jgi:WD40 repeat protein
VTPDALRAAISQHDLLPRAQAEEMLRQAASAADVESLVRAWVERGWLTDFQAERVLCGRVGDLFLGPYRLLELLGRGGMGQVFKARHRHLDRLAALKIIRPDLLTRPGAAERFVREARAAARCVHPHIVLVYDAGEAGGSPYVAMEYVEGTDLARLVHDRGPLAVAEACACARQAALGLQYAHEQGLIHRDVKPSNLLLARGPAGAPVVKVLDFGLARLASEVADGSALTETGQILGTLDFMAPEQAQDARSADVRADVFSLGATLFFLLTGQAPFPGRSATEKLAARLSGPARPVRALRPDVPKELAAVIARTLERDPAKRYPTPAAVARALTPFVPTPAVTPTDGSDIETAAYTSPAPLPRPRRRGARRLVLITGGVIVALAAAVTLVVGLRTGLPGGDTASGTGDTHRDPPAAREPAPKVVAPAAVIPDDARTEWKAADYDPPPELVAVLGAHRQRHWGRGIVALALAPDGKSLASWGSDSSVRLWDVPPPGSADPLRPRKVIRCSLSGTNYGFKPAFAWSADGRRLTLLSGSEVLQIDSASGKMDGAWMAQDAGGPQFRPPDLPLRALASDRHARRVLAGYNDGSLGLWDTSTHKEIRHFAGHKRAVTVSALSPDGKRAITGGEDRSVILWNTETGKEIKRLEGHTELLTWVSFAVDARRAVTAGGDQRVLVWDASRGEKVKEFDPVDGVIHRVELSSDGSQVIVLQATGDGFALATLDVDARSKAGPIVLPGQPSSLLCEPGTGRVFTGGQDGTVRLWDRNSAKEVGPPWTGPVGRCGPLTFLDGGKLLLVSYDSPSRPWVWDLASGKELPDHPLAKPEIGVEAVSSEGVPVLYHRTRKELSIPGVTARPIPQDQEYKRCALSADRRALVLWGKFWDVAAGKEVKPRGDLTDRRPLGFAPDGRTVAMADWHLTGVEFWDATTGEKLAQKPLAGVRHAAFAPRADADGGVLFVVHNTTDRARE